MSDEGLLMSPALYRQIQRVIKQQLNGVGYGNPEQLQQSRNVIQRRWSAVLTEDLASDPGIYATGTVTASSDTVTTSEDLSAYDDYVIVIAGAGVGGANHVSVLSASTSSTVTLAAAVATSVTDADITLLAVADAFPVYRRKGGRWTRILDSTGATYVRYPVVNPFQHITLSANTLVGVERLNGMWEVYKADCEAGVWEWGEY